LISLLFVTCHEIQPANNNNNNTTRSCCCCWRLVVAKDLQGPTTGMSRSWQTGSNQHRQFRLTIPDKCSNKRKKKKNWRTSW
jgi:hypothetical protein